MGSAYDEFIMYDLCGWIVSFCIVSISRLKQAAQIELRRRSVARMRGGERGGSGEGPVAWARVWEGRRGGCRGLGRPTGPAASYREGRRGGRRGARPRPPGRDARWVGHSQKRRTDRGCAYGLLPRGRRADLRLGRAALVHGSVAGWVGRRGEVWHVLLWRWLSFCLTCSDAWAVLLVFRRYGCSR